MLEVHLRGKPVADDVDVAVLARRTPGFSGADLANLVNEGALLAARRGGDRIAAVDLTAAVERVLAGPERSRILSEDERRVVAVHESGHAIVSHVLPHADGVHKVSIVSRGRPWATRCCCRRTATSDEVGPAVGPAGGGAGRPGGRRGGLRPADHRGVIDDIQRATRLARAMVTEYGMSDKPDPAVSCPATASRSWPRPGSPADHGAEVAARVDEEVSRLLDEAHERARRILEDHRPGLDRLASTLLERETVADAELADLLAAVGDP